jgi:hypothetical protein
MPLQPAASPLGVFLKALREEGIDCILIGATAAIEQGAPLMTVDHDFWMRLPERQYVRLLPILRRTLRLAKRLEGSRPLPRRPTKRRNQGRPRQRKR